MTTSIFILLATLTLVLNLYSITSDKWSVRDISRSEVEDNTILKTMLQHSEMTNAELNIGLLNICGRLDVNILDTNAYGKACMNLSGRMVENMFPTNTLYACRILSGISILLLIMGRLTAEIKS